MSDILRELALAKAVFQLRAIEAVIYAGAIADRSPSWSRPQGSVDESGGAEGNRTNSVLLHKRSD